MKNIKKMYNAPSLVVHGNLETLTQGSADGNSLDAAFPTGTPKAQLTFS
jgi:hypothetical protein